MKDTPTGLGVMRELANLNVRAPEGCGYWGTGGVYHGATPRLNFARVKGVASTGLHQLRENFGVLLSDAQQGFSRSAWFASPLFPILHCAQTNPHQTSKGGLRDFEFGTDLLGRGRSCEFMRSQDPLTYFVGFDLA
jgi:hypothetical protein